MVCLPLILSWDRYSYTSNGEAVIATWGKMEESRLLEACLKLLVSASTNKQSLNPLFRNLVLASQSGKKLEALANISQV